MSLPARFKTTKQLSAQDKGTPLSINMYCRQCTCNSRFSIDVSTLEVWRCKWCGKVNNEPVDLSNQWGVTIN